MAEGFESADRALWCPECGALKTSDAEWQPPAVPLTGELLGTMLGGALRTAFPGATTKLEKFVDGMTENSETIQWKPATDVPASVMMPVLFRVDDGGVRVGFPKSNGWWCALEENVAQYPPESVTHYAEMPTGPRPEETEPE